MDKIDQQIIEAVNDVVNPDTTERDQLVMEYLEGYFGNELNESTSDEDVMEAFDTLLATADAVAEFMIQEGGARDARMTAAKERGAKTGVKAAAQLRKTGVVTGRQAADIAKKAEQGSQLSDRQRSNIDFRASRAAKRREKFVAKTGADPKLSVAQKTKMIGRAQGHTTRAAATDKRVNPGGKATAAFRPKDRPGRAGNRGQVVTRDRDMDSMRFGEKERTRSTRGSGSDQLRKKRPALKPKPKPVISPKAAAPVKQGLGARLMSRLKGG